MGDWSYNDLRKVIEKAKSERDKNVTIDQKHTEYANAIKVKEWNGQQPTTEVAGVLVIIIKRK